MKVLASTGKEEVAVVYIAEMDNGRHVEFVESVQPPVPRSRKWVLIVSTLFGCPVGCRFCDAGGSYFGKLRRREIISQIDYLVRRRFHGGAVPVEKFKVQFARMGEPSFNHEVLDVLEELPARYKAPGLIPCISTIAPGGTDGFFERMLKIKKELYGGRFQLQFSIHTTDVKLRDWLMPVRKWDIGRIAEYGDDFFDKGGRKVTLNFALAEGMPVDTDILSTHFSPERFLIKITPVNPTYHALKNNLASQVLPGKGSLAVMDSLRGAGYEVILSIGELEENHIGSNCGQHIMNYLKGEERIEDGYTYRLTGV